MAHTYPGVSGHGGAATEHGSQIVFGKVPGGSFHRVPIVGAACHRACGRCRAAMPVPATDAPSPLGQAVHALRNPVFEWAHAAAALRYRCQFARGEDQLPSPLHRAAIPTRTERPARRLNAHRTSLVAGPFRLESDSAIIKPCNISQQIRGCHPTGERAPVAIPRPRSPWELPWATVPLGYHAIIV